MRPPGVTKGSWRAGGELGFREGESKPERVMEIKLPNRSLMRARIPGFAGLRITRNSHKRRLANKIMHLTVSGAYADSM